MKSYQPCALVASKHPLRSRRASDRPRHRGRVGKQREKQHEIIFMHRQTEASGGTHNDQDCTPSISAWMLLPTAERTHKSRLVREFIESLNGHIEVEFLPAYAPELNPAEYIWGHLKQHEIGNLCVKNLAELSPYARNRLRSMQRRPRLIAAFWVQAELAL